MKRLNILLLLATAITFVGCGLNNDRGELTGVPNRKQWFHPQPYGMVYVPTGTFHMGQSDQDIWSTYVAQNRQVSVVAFYMDDTEISNNEYRQFVYEVMDSLARELLQGEYIVEDANGGHSLNRRKRLNWGAEENKEALQDLFYNESERYFKLDEIDTRKLIYHWEWIDLQTAALNTGQPQWQKNRADYLRKEDTRIYPDTLAFVRDFVYSYNEPMTRLYFWHPKYDNYPVVGVNWKQAKAFCHWRTQHLHSYYREFGDPVTDIFRLPTESEWEYAARGGRDGNMYPWGGPYVRNTKGCFLANFKPGRGNYIDDGGFYPVKVNAYFPNDYGLYCMAGNVAEWTLNAYNEQHNMSADDMNPDYQYEAKEDDPYQMKRKVIRGGSWKDIAFYIQNGTRAAYEFQDSAKSFVGFRCVTTYIGRSNKDKE